MLTLLNLKDVLKATGLSRVHIWGRIKAGTFPASVRLSDERKHLYFRQDQVKKWIKDHAAWKRACAKRVRPGKRMGTGLEPDGAAKDKRATETLQATVKDLSARVTQLEARVNTCEPAIGRAHRGLAELTDKLDANTPGKVPAYESDKLEARARLTAVE